MGSLSSKLNKIVLTIQEYIMLISSIAIASMIFVGSIMRYIFKSDFYGMEELVLMFAFWLYFLGSSYAAYEDSHINADLLSSFIKDDTKKTILAIVKYSLSLAVSILTTIWCVQFIIWNINLNPKTPVYGIPLLTSQFAICISFILMTIYIFGHLLNNINNLKKLKKK